MALGSLVSDGILAAVAVNYPLGDLQLFLYARDAQRLRDGFLFGMRRQTY